MSQQRYYPKDKLHIKFTPHGLKQENKATGEVSNATQSKQQAFKNSYERVSENVPAAKIKLKLSKDAAHSSGKGFEHSQEPQGTSPSNATKSAAEKSKFSKKRNAVEKAWDRDLNRFVEEKYDQTAEESQNYGVQTANVYRKGAKVGARYGAVKGKEYRHTEMERKTAKQIKKENKALLQAFRDNRYEQMA